MVETKMVVVSSSSNGGHSPTLDSLKMIESTIKSENGKLTKTEIWEALPRKMMYQTYKQAMDYFTQQKKVILRGRKVFWISYPDTMLKLLEKTHSIN